jgi:hypothetical protein
VGLKILFTSNATFKEIVGHNGEIIYSAELKPDSKGNTNIGIRTNAQAFAPGYISATKTSLSSSSTSIITNSNSSGSSKAIISSSIINNNTSSNLEQNILRNVQKRLEQMVLISLLVNNGS